MAWLAYMGTIPFVSGAMLSLFGYQQVFFSNDMISIVNSYGLAIVIFMSGIHWGNYISDSRCNSINLLITSISITLLAWLVFLLTPVYLTLSFYCICFLSLLLIDTRLVNLQVISRSYFKLRLIVTSVVIISLLLIVFSVMREY